MYLNPDVYRLLIYSDRESHKFENHHPGCMPTPNLGWPRLSDPKSHKPDYLTNPIVVQPHLSETPIVMNPNIHTAKLSGMGTMRNVLYSYGRTDTSKMDRISSLRERRNRLVSIIKSR